MRFFRLLLYILTIVFLSSCGEDRTYEYIEKRANDNWIYQVMKENYLWNDKMQDSTENAFFAYPENFLKKIVFTGNNSFKSDKFSYVEILNDTISAYGNYLNEESTYGFDFELIKNPTNDKKYKYTYARILFVLPNSPAYDAGLKRGDWISKVNNAAVTEDNYGFLIQGQAASFTVCNLEQNLDSLVWRNEREISISASRKVENNPFYVDTLYNVGGTKIAYMVYNKFSTGSDNDSKDTRYLNQMKQIFSKFKSEAPDAFILDLRYNPGGSLSCAQELASMLVPEDALGKTFAKLKYNESNKDKDTTYYYMENLAPYNLNLKNIYIITSNYTEAASEIVINCLKPYMGKDNVITIGEEMAGNNFIFGSFTSPDASFILHPVVAYVQNSSNSINYLNDMKPTYGISERSHYDTLLPLGDVNELLLKNTISFITTNSMPDYSTETTKKSIVR